MEADSTSQSEFEIDLFKRRLKAISIALAVASGTMMRLWMFKRYYQVGYDSLVYGGIAKHLLQQGGYLLTRSSGEILPTMIRLPGYPFFLAICFRLFGTENYASAVWVQIVLEMASCLLLADCARRIAPAALRRWAAHGALWLAALCPFTAIYAVQPLTESLTLSSIALALWSVACFRERAGWTPALCFAVSVSYTALLRPDGALIAVALAPAMVIGLKRGEGKPSPLKTTRLIRMAVVCTLLVLAPFAFWTARNWRVFHVFQPLAPRYANDPDQTSYPGWQRWVKTWSLDFISTFDIYWPVPGAPLDLSKLPSRAFDSPEEYAKTVALISAYNIEDQASDIVPEVDERFGQLAEERIHAHPARYYLWLPLGRLADMWLRPRIEILYDDGLDWWRYSRHPLQSRVSWALAGLNLLYLLLAAAGISLRPRLWPWLLTYMLMRSALLMTIESPETRYTLECFPILFVLGGIGLSAGWRRFAGPTPIVEGNIVDSKTLLPN